MEWGPTGKVVHRHRVANYEHIGSMRATNRPASELEALMQAPPGHEPDWVEPTDDASPRDVAVSRMLMLLEPREAAVLTALYWEGLSIREIADKYPELGTKSTVDRIAHAARAQLAVLLAPLVDGVVSSRSVGIMDS